MRPIRSALVALVSASLALGAPGLAGLAAAAAPAIKPLAVRIGQAKDLTHIEFPGSNPVSSRVVGKDLLLRFARASSPDLVQLKVAPPRFSKPATITA